MGRIDYSKPGVTHCLNGCDLRLPGAIFEDCYGRRGCTVCRQRRDREHKARKAAEKKKASKVVAP